MQNQEKHPIDELFAKRLQGMEQMPSARAWDKLQSQLTKKKDSNNAIYWAIAASVALLLGSFTVVFYWKPETQLATAPPKVPTPVRVRPNQLPAVITESQQPIAQVAPEVPSQSEPLRNVTTHIPKVRVLKQESGNPESLTQETIPVLQVEAASKIERMASIEQQERIAMHTETAMVPQLPANSEVTVFVVELVNTDTPENPDKGTEAEPAVTRKAEKLWQAIKKAKKTEINLDKEAIVAWVKERNQKN